MTVQNAGSEIHGTKSSCLSQQSVNAFVLRAFLLGRSKTRDQRPEPRTKIRDQFLGHQKSHFLCNNLDKN